jgi:two-component system LytT family response regulator
MKKCIIIDDEPLARSLVKEHLAAHSNLELVAECGDGFEGLKAIQQHKPDLVFLDIQMPKITGFEMLELLDPAPQIIFITAFDEFAIKAFEQHAVDYLLKPFSKERFDNAIKKWQANTQTNSTISPLTNLSNESNKSAEETERIVIKVNGEIKIVPTKDVYYIEAFDDYVKIFTANDWFLKKKTMAYFEKSLEANNFVRVHRSFIINLSHITKIEPYEKDGHLVILKNGSKISVSRGGYTKLKEVLGI